MLRAGVLSLLIFAIGAGCHEGYKLLLSTIDAHVGQSAKFLESQPQPELQAAGAEINNSYSKIRIRR